jgi:hypothetical protein
MTKASTMSQNSEEDAIPDEDTSEASTLAHCQLPAADSQQVTRLFGERLQAWKHACGYLEDYISATERLHREQAKEYDRVLKVHLIYVRGIFKADHRNRRSRSRSRKAITLSRILAG